MIFRTPSTVDTEVKCGSTYKYLGIELGIKKYVNHKAITDNVIKLFSVLMESILAKLGQYYARSTMARFLWWHCILVKISPLQLKNIWQTLLMN